MAGITEAARVGMEFAKAMRMRVVDGGGAFCGVPGLVAVDEGGALRFIEARGAGEAAAGADDVAEAVSAWLMEWGVDGFVETELAIDLIEIKEIHGHPVLRYVEGAHAA